MKFRIAIAFFLLLVCIGQPHVLNAADATVSGSISGYTGKSGDGTSYYQYGGHYTVNGSGTCVVGNPNTGTCSCMAGYGAAVMADVYSYKWYSGDWGEIQEHQPAYTRISYICIRGY